MEGSPGEFEAIGNRLGFSTREETPDRLVLSWQGPRFPAFLCLGIAILLLFVSVPIAQAIYLNGFSSRAASLWYFPFMNVVLFVIAVYLLGQRRTITIDSASRTVLLRKRHLVKKPSLNVAFGEIESVNLVLDQVYSGFAVAGSSAAQAFPVPSLRLVISGGETVLLDRGSRRRLEEVGRKIAARLGKELRTPGEGRSAPGSRFNVQGSM
jgi:hypothetical protein